MMMWLPACTEKAKSMSGPPEHLNPSAAAQFRSWGVFGAVLVESCLEALFRTAVRVSGAAFPAPGCASAKGPYLDSWSKASGGTDCRLSWSGTQEQVGDN